MSELALPIPSANQVLIAVAWAGFTYQMSRALTKQLDEDITKDPIIAGMHPWAQSLIKRILAGAHHWVLGLFMVIYLQSPIDLLGHTVNQNMELVWAGLGMVLEDKKDIPSEIIDYFSSVLEAFRKSRSTT